MVWRSFMSSIFKVTMLAISLVFMAYCGAVQSEEKKAVASVPAKKGLNKPINKQSYSLGVSFGEYLKRALDENKKVDINLSTEFVLQGVRDALSGDKKLSKVEIEAVMKSLDKLTRRKHTELAEAKKQQAIKLEKDYMAKNAIKEGVNVTASGLQFKVLVLGNGAKPTRSDRVKVHYRGTLMDGTQFDSSYKRKEAAEFGVSQVIKGWTEGLQLMPVGSKFSFTIPSALGYGKRATGKIKAHSVLLFDVELLEIITPAPISQQ